MTTSRFQLTRVSGQPVTDADILADLKCIASKLGAKTVSQPRYRQYGRYDETTVARRFGSWNKALLTAGLALSGGAEGAGKSGVKGQSPIVA
jgi:hypothetical protein